MTVDIATTAGGSNELPAVWSRRRDVVPALAAASIFVGLLIAANYLGQEGGSRLGRSLILGALFGIVLQRSRFCFFCHVRDFFERRDARGIAAILLALGVGTLGYLVVMTAWLPDPASRRLPPDAHIGPTAITTLIAAFVFGIGMTVSGSCISGHLYRLGEGSPTAPFALVGTLIGFALGFQTWNTLYVAAIAEAPVIWLPAFTTYSWWLALQLATLVALLAIVAHLGRRAISGEPHQPHNVLAAALRRIFKDRWPATVGGAAVGVLAAVAYFQVQPLGVTAALGSVARAASQALNILPETLHGLDRYAGCRTTPATGLSNNGAFVIGLVAASFASALVAGQFTPSWPTLRQAGRGIAGGILLGWGAMTAIGCTVGTLLSGTMAGAASGWIFLIASFAGVWIALLAQKRLNTRESAPPSPYPSPQARHRKTHTHPRGSLGEYVAMMSTAAKTASRSASFILLFLGLQALAAAPAFAGRFDFDPRRTEVRFAYTMAYSKQRGRFTKVNGSVEYDEAKPEKSKISASIATASLTTGEPLVDSELKGKAFFNVAASPAIVFKSISVKPRSSTQADVSGEITVNGITKPVTLAVSLKPHDDPTLKYDVGSREFIATTRIQRSAFNMTDYKSMVDDDIDIEIAAIVRPSSTSATQLQK